MSNGIYMFGVSDARIFDSNGFGSTGFLVKSSWVEIHRFDPILSRFKYNQTAVVRIGYLLSQINPFNLKQSLVKKIPIQNFILNF